MRHHVAFDINISVPEENSASNFRDKFDSVRQHSFAHYHLSEDRYMPAVGSNSVRCRFVIIILIKCSIFRIGLILC
jgi:hypothetical protein